MALFGKKKEKLTPEQLRERVEASVERTEEFVRKADRKRRDLLEKAKLAKAKGDKGSYNMAVSALRTVMIQQKRAEQMVLSMQVMQDYRDVNALTGSFMETMQFMCAELGQMPDLKQMSKVAEDFNRNMQKAAYQSEMMDEFMTSMSDSMSAGSFESNNMDDEIGQAIESQLAAELDAEDIEVARKLEEAKRRMESN